MLTYKSYGDKKTINVFIPGEGYLDNIDVNDIDTIVEVIKESDLYKKYVKHTQGKKNFR